MADYFDETSDPLTSALLNPPPFRPGVRGGSQPPQAGSYSTPNGFWREGFAGEAKPETTFTPPTTGSLAGYGISSAGSLRGPVPSGSVRGDGRPPSIVSSQAAEQTQQLVDPENPSFTPATTGPSAPLVVNGTERGPLFATGPGSSAYNGDLSAYGYFRDSSGRPVVDTPENRAGHARAEASLSAMDAYNRGLLSRGIFNQVDPGSFLHWNEDAGHRRGTLGVAQDAQRLAGDLGRGYQSNGAFVPGSAATNALNAETNSRSVDQQRAGPAAAADAASRLRIQALRSSAAGQGMTPQQALDVIRREEPDFHIPSDMPGGTANPAAPMPAYWPGGRNVNQPPVANRQAGSIIPGSATDAAAGVANQLAGQATTPVPIAGRPSPAALTAIDRAINRAATNIPRTRGQPNAQGIAPEEVPVPRSSATQDAYDHAITIALESIPDDVLRGNFPAIQQRLENMVGGSEALNQWINRNSASAIYSEDAGRRMRQRDRIMGMAGMNPNPPSLWDAGSGSLLRRAANTIPGLGLGSVLLPYAWR